MNITIVVPTHNRLEYTKKTLSRLLEDTTEEFDLYLWDNASEDETPEYLKSLKDPRIVEVILSKENAGQTGAMNYAWSKTKAELVGKLDNDCLVTPGWTRIFARAHKDIQKLGSVALWHFPFEDFDEALAAKKVVEFDGHKIFRHPWTCGSGFILKRNTFLKCGLWPQGSYVGTTGYFLKIALAGYINGWYYPLILQEHMDDPSSIHSLLHQSEFNKAYEDSYGYNYADIKEMKKYMEVREKIIHNLMNDPYDPRYYVGWRKKLRRVLSRFNWAKIK